MKGRKTMTTKLTARQMQVLDKLLPSASLLGCALSYELGRARARGLYDDYPEGFNREMSEVAASFRSWLVNPPNGKYDFTIG